MRVGNTPSLLSVDTKMVAPNHGCFCCSIFLLHCVFYYFRYTCLAGHLPHIWKFV